MSQQALLRISMPVHAGGKQRPAAGSNKGNCASDARVLAGRLQLKRSLEMRSFKFSTEWPWMEHACGCY
jgi:hypothetical protein